MIGTRNMLAAKLAVLAVMLAVAWTVIASLVFLTGTRLIRQFGHPFYQWWLYFWYGRDNAMVVRWLEISAGTASAIIVIFAAALVIRGRKSGRRSGRTCLAASQIRSEAEPIISAMRTGYRSGRRSSCSPDRRLSMAAWSLARRIGSIRIARR